VLAILDGDAVLHEMPPDKISIEDKAAWARVEAEQRDAESRAIIPIVEALRPQRAGM
jgi:hypothetical protein